MELSPDHLESVASLLRSESAAVARQGSELLSSLLSDQPPARATVVILQVLQHLQKEKNGFIRQRQVEGTLRALRDTLARAGEGERPGVLALHLAVRVALETGTKIPRSLNCCEGDGALALLQATHYACGEPYYEPGKSDPAFVSRHAGLPVTREVLRDFAQHPTRTPIRWGDLGALLQEMLLQQAVGCGCQARPGMIPQHDYYGPYWEERARWEPCTREAHLFAATLWNRTPGSPRTMALLHPPPAGTKTRQKRPYQSMPHILRRHTGHYAEDGKVYWKQRVVGRWVYQISVADGSRQIRLSERRMRDLPGIVRLLRAVQQRGTQVHQQRVALAQELWSYPHGVTCLTSRPARFTPKAPEDESEIEFVAHTYNTQVGHDDQGQIHLWIQRTCRRPEEAPQPWNSHLAWLAHKMESKVRYYSRAQHLLMDVLEYLLIRALPPDHEGSLAHFHIAGQDFYLCQNPSTRGVYGAPPWFLIRQAAPSLPLYQPQGLRVDLSDPRHPAVTVDTARGAS